MRTVLAGLVLAVFIGYGTAGRASELKSLCDGIEELFETPPDSFEDFRGKRWDTASGYWDSDRTLPGASCSVSERIRKSGDTRHSFRCKWEYDDVGEATTEGRRLARVVQRCAQKSGDPWKDYTAEAREDDDQGTTTIDDRSAKGDGYTKSTSIQVEKNSRTGKTSVAVSVTYLDRSVTRAAGEALDIPPVIQKTLNWCWAAVTEMANRYYGVPSANAFGNYQCGIIGVMALHDGNLACNFNCYQCPVSAGTAQYLVHTLNSYPRLIGSRKRVSARHISRALRASEIKSEIDSGDPIIVGINPSGRPAGLSVSEHVALIVGYKDEGDVLIVNDPAPFEYVSWRNPYEQAGGEKIDEDGQYEITRQALVSRLSWGETILVTNR